MSKKYAICEVSNSKNDRGFDVSFRGGTLCVRLSCDNTEILSYVNRRDNETEGAKWKLSAFDPFAKSAFRALAGGFKDLPWRDMDFWRNNPVAKDLGGNVRSAWMKLIKNVPPRLLALDKRLYQVTRNPTPSPLMQFFTLLDSCEYLMRDVYKLAPAAIVVDSPHLFFNLTLFIQKIGNERIIDHYPDWGFKQTDSSNAITYEDVLEKLAEDWKRCYSYNLKPYTSLNKTLSNFPKVSPETASRLNQVKLDHPIYTKAEMWLMAWGYRMKGGRLDGEGQPIHHQNDIFSHSTHHQIKRALKVLAAHQRRQLFVHRAANVIDLAHYALDYPGTHNGNIVGLVNKSIKYHRDVYARRIREETVYPFETPTTVPPILMPRTNKVNFLATVGDVIREGDLMSHCIGGYANGAVRGLYYLFHVSCNHYEASVQVDANTGRVLQAYGPNNTKNQATEWGRSYLTQWGKEIILARQLDDRLTPRQKAAIEGFV